MELYGSDGEPFAFLVAHPSTTHLSDEDPSPGIPGRAMDGAQFHPSWVGNATGKLGRNKFVDC